jgi:hypothetical protein
MVILNDRRTHRAVSLLFVYLQNTTAIISNVLIINQQILFSEYREVKTDRDSCHE